MIVALFLLGFPMTFGYDIMTVILVHKRFYQSENKYIHIKLTALICGIGSAVKVTLRLAITS